MKSNCEICSLVEDIKILQKQYVKGNYSDEAVKRELDLKGKRLEGIPLYIEYMNYLERVNEMINLVKDELNAYFIDLLSIEIKND